MRTVIYLPPLARMSGGLEMLLNLGGHLLALDRQALFATTNALGPEIRRAVTDAFGPHMLRDWKETPLTPDDLYIVPEGWPNALAPAFKAGARPVVYAQSWNFMLTNLPRGVSWQQLPVEFLAVSRPVARFMEEILGLNVFGILPPAADELFFQSSERPRNCVRVAWMPRKNRALAEQARAVALALLERDNIGDLVEWFEIRDMTRAEVAAALASSHIYLATAFPEGFGLPPLEAMACGCVPVGFTGFGGWEYMRPADKSFMPPPFLYAGSGSRFLLDMDQPANGFFTSDGDILSAGQSLHRAILLARENGPAWRALTAAGQKTAGRYSPENQRMSVDRLWRELTQNPRKVRQ